MRRTARAVPFVGRATRARATQGLWQEAARLPICVTRRGLGARRKQVYYAVSTGLPHAGLAHVGAKVEALRVGLADEVGFVKGIVVERSGAWGPGGGDHEECP